MALYFYACNIPNCDPALKLPQSSYERFLQQCIAYAVDGTLSAVHKLRLLDPRLYDALHLDSYRSIHI